MAPGELFAFVQLEFTHSLGPPTGRYVVPPEGAVEPPGELRAAGSADVLVLQVVAGKAAERGGLLRRRSRDVAAGAPPREVSLALATFVEATTPLDRGAAADLLERLRASEAEREERIARALAVLNLAIRAHRAAARDPYAVEVARLDARAVRIGCGTADEVYDGSWQEAFAAPPPAARRPSREERLLPAQLVGGVLARRARLLDADELLVRGLLDLEHGRPHCAAVQLAAAVDSLAAELGAESVTDEALQRVAALSERALPARRLAERPPSSSPTGAEATALRGLALELGELLDAWHAESLA